MSFKTPPPPLPYREVWYASPVVTALDTNTAETAQIKMNDAATVDFDRLIGMAAQSAIGATALYPTHNFVQGVFVQSLKVNQTDPLVVGVPASATLTGAFPLDPRRRMPRNFGFGRRDLATNNTLDTTIIVQGTGLVCDFSFAAPGSSNYKNQIFRPIGNPKLLAGASDYDVAADGATDTMTLEAPYECYAWLDFLQLAALPDAAATSEEQTNADGLGVCGIASITLPGDEELVQGDGAGIVPAAAYDQNRGFNWVRHGWVRLNQGSKILIGVQNHGPDAVNVAASVPVWQVGPGGRAGRCG